MSGNPKKHPKQRTRVYQKSDQQRRNGAERIRLFAFSTELLKTKKFYGYNHRDGMKFSQENVHNNENSIHNAFFS